MSEVVIDYERPFLYPKQLQAIFAPERYSVIEASTKSGKTHGCIIWLMEEALLGEKGEYWWIAPVSDQTDIAFRRMSDALRPLIDAGHVIVNKTRKFISLANGNVLWFKSADEPDSLYGEDVRAAVIDECSRVKEAAWFALRSTLTATRGRARFIGNVKGRKNWFYKLARQAEKGRENWAFFKLTAYDAVDGGVLHTEEIAGAQEDLPDYIFKELYLAEAGDDAGNPFGLKFIQKCICQRLSARPVAAFGIDLAKYRDWTVVIGLDSDGHVCYFERWQSTWNTTFKRIDEIVSKSYRGIPVLIDSTGVGDPIVESLQLNWPTVQGFKFSSQSKQQLMEGLAVAIQKNELHFPEGLIVDELESFEYEYTKTGVRYTAPEGEHDDCVISLALAQRALSLAPKRMKWKLLA
jgi:phage FluMu gp28-like protein